MCVCVPLNTFSCVFFLCRLTVECNLYGIELDTFFVFVFLSFPCNLRSIELELTLPRWKWLFGRSLGIFDQLIFISRIDKMKREKLHENSPFFCPSSSMNEKNNGSIQIDYATAIVKIQYDTFDCINSVHFHLIPTIYFICKSTCHMTQKVNYITVTYTHFVDAKKNI